MSAKQWTPRQLALALDEVSRGARALERIALMQQRAQDDDDPRDVEALALVVEFLAQRTGWIADAASHGAAPGKSCVDLRTPLQWCMPPVFGE